MVFRFTYRFKELHGGSRALWFGAFVVWSAVATAGEVSSAGNDKLIGQLGILQETLSQVATASGVSVPATLTLPIGKPAPSSAPEEKSEAAEKSANSLAGASAPAELAPVKSARVGEYAVPSAVGSIDPSDLTGGSALNLPNAGNLGNFDQVVGALQPLSGDSESIPAFRPPSGFGSGSLVMPSSAAQSALSRGIGSDAVASSLSTANAGRAQFGDMREFTIGSGANPSPKAAKEAREAAAEADREKELAKESNADDEAKKKEEEKKRLSEKELKEKFSELSAKVPPFKFEDYEQFRDLISDDGRRVQELMSQNPDFGKKAKTIFEMFSNEDRLVKTQEKKKDYGSFVAQQGQPKSALEEGFQQAVNEEPETGERSNIQRSSRPVDSTH